MTSSLLSPLSAIAVGPKSPIVPRTSATRSTFSDVKEALAKLVTLKFYNPLCHLQLTTDVSDVIGNFS